MATVSFSGGDSNRPVSVDSIADTLIKADVDSVEYTEATLDEKGIYFYWEGGFYHLNDEEFSELQNLVPNATFYSHNSRRNGEIVNAAAVRSLYPGALDKFEHTPQFAAGAREHGADAFLDSEYSFWVRDDDTLMCDDYGGVDYPRKWDEKNKEWIDLSQEWRRESMNTNEAATSMAPSTNQMSHPAQQFLTAAEVQEQDPNAITALQRSYQARGTQRSISFFDTAWLFWLDGQGNLWMNSKTSANDLYYWDGTRWSSSRASAESQKQQIKALIAKTLAEAAKKLAHEGFTDLFKRKSTKIGAPPDEPLSPGGGNLPHRFYQPRGPVRFSTGSAETDIDNAVRQPFTALDYAATYGHHPRLWQVVKNSPFAQQYRDLVAKGQDPDSLHV
jgi:hypothetical protein